MRRRFPNNLPLILLFLAVLIAAAAIFLAMQLRLAPANPATLAISGPIVDAITGSAVVADVYVDGKLVLSKTDHLELIIPLQHDQQTEIRVRAPGYVDWAIAVRGGRSEQMQGPVRMNRKNS